MKYLVFNLVVAAALIYLFNGPEGGLGGIKEKAFESVDAVKAKGESLALPTIPEPEPIVQALAEPQPLNVEAPAMPEPIDVPKLTIPEMPPLSFDTVPQAPQEEVTLSFPDEEQSGFMTTKDRHKALLRLAEDMEYFSA